MTPEAARQLLERVTEDWVADPDSDAVWAGAHEGRWGVRLRQRTREATTIWFDVAERTIGVEAYLLPSPPREREEVYRQALRRNLTAWPATIGVDSDGDLFIVARVPIANLTQTDIDRAVGAVYQLVDLAFPSMISTGFAPREKSG